MLPVRPELLTLTEAIHGAVNRSELVALGLDPNAVLDFSASIIPFGPSPRVVEAIANTWIDLYPDRDATEFRRALSDHLGMPMERLIAGNGSSELLFLLGFAFIRPGDPVLVVGPTYSEYARVAQSMGATVHDCLADERSEFRFPISQVETSLQTVRPRIVFICHPNNPTGRTAPADAIGQWAERFPQTMFVIDEAYIEFTPDATSTIKLTLDNIVVLRSMTKAFGLAGLRLGYAVSSPTVVDFLARVRPPWSVSSVAQNAGIAALQDSGHLQQGLANLAAEKQFLVDQLRSLDARVLSSETHFFLVRVEDASATRQCLLKSGIIVRDCASFGLPHLLRISPQTRSGNVGFCETWKQSCLSTKTSSK